MTTETTKTVDTLTAVHGVWGAHDTWPVQDWKYEVDNDNTRLGYWEWVAQQIEIHADPTDAESGR